MALNLISGDIIYGDASSLPDSQGESQMRIQVAGFDSSVEKRFRFAAKKLSEKWFFDSLFYVPVQVGDQTVLLNLCSTAKRLGVSYWTVRKACKEGTLDKLIAAKAAKASLEKLTVLRHHLPEEEAVAIQTFVNRELPKWRAQKKRRFIHASEATAPRTIQYDPKHDVIYVHLNRKPDKYLGEGATRTYKLTLNYTTDQTLARGVALLGESQRENRKQAPRAVIMGAWLTNESRRHTKT